MSEFTTYAPKAELTQEALENRYFGFPEGLALHAYLQLSDRLRERIAMNNRIIQTDTYNRTMNHVEGDDWDKPATYALQLRRSPHDYLIAMGMRRAIEYIAKRRITQDELDFATEFYENEANVPYFNRDMWQWVIDEHDGYLPIEIDTVPEGTAVLPGDPVIRVSGPNELIAHFEPDFHRIFNETLIATKCHVIDREFHGRFIEVGKRGTATEELHLMAAHAMYAGGGIELTSNDAATVAYSVLKDIGTIGHRYVQAESIQAFHTERDAFVKAIETLDSVSLLIDLVDSYDGIELALELKEEYRNSGKNISIRLDSGDILGQAVYVMQQYAARGFLERGDKVIVEGISSVQDMRDIDAAVREAGFDPQANVLYGAGGLVVAKEVSRSHASTGFKLAMIDGDPTMKFSDSPGKRSNPGNPTLRYHEGQRYIGQVGEQLGQDLFVPAYRYPGNVLLSEELTPIREHVARSFEQIREVVTSGEAHSEWSPKTQELEKEIMQHYGIA